MSGIAGIIHFDGRPVESGLIEGMTAAIRYRGPDGIAHWRDGSVALGQCMLRTTPEAREETQPLTNEDASLVLVMDGRVDNPEELRSELLARGVKLRDRSDAELVLRAFECWGRDCLEHIDGDFALAVWNARERTLFCARDRIGNKPFHYHWNGNTFAFASDLHPILGLPWVEPQPNEGMLAEFLAARWYSRDETLWVGILRLVAAHRMSVSARGARPECWWRPDPWAPAPAADEAGCIEAYREMLTEQVRRATRSHRPVTTEVSGGLDSSALFCIAERLRREGRLSAPAIEAYTIAFPDDAAANELEYARAVGAHMGSRIEEIAPTLPPLEWFADVARESRDFPGFPNAAMFEQARTQAAQRGSRVVMTGEGGDEWLEGSRNYYAEEFAAGHWRVLRDCWREDATAFGNRQALRWALRYGLLALLPDPIGRGSYALVRGLRPSPSQRVGWLSPAMRERLAQRRRDAIRPQPRLRRAGQRELLATHEDAFNALAVEMAERQCARTGLELRCPMRSAAMLQFAFATPERLRLRGGQSKHLHLQALQDVLPQALLARRDKAEFSGVFRSRLDQMAELLTESVPYRRKEWLTQNGMKMLYHDHYAAHPDWGWPLWRLWSIYACDSISQR
jgi:asparagine synthase (glutamine-hydrolysing)